MNEPRRWLDEPAAVPTEVRKLLEAAQAPKPMTRQQRALSVEHIERLEARATLPMKHSFIFRAGPVLAIILAAALAAAAVPALSKFVAKWHSSDKPSVIVESVPRLEKPVASAMPRASIRQEKPIDTPVAQPDENPDDVPAPANSSMKIPMTKGAPKIVTEPLREQEPIESPPAPANTEQQQFEEEVLLLDQARALRQSNPNKALELLNEHAGRFPRGRLGFDRELLTIEALRQAGRLSDARSRAQALLDRAMGKPHEEKMRRIVESLQ